VVTLFGEGRPSRRVETNGVRSKKYIVGRTAAGTGFTSVNRARALPTRNSTAVWAAQFQPAALPDQRGGAYLSAADLDDLRIVIESLHDAQLSAWNAQRRGDVAALAKGLRELADAVHEGVEVLRPLIN